MEDYTVKRPESTSFSITNTPAASTDTGLNCRQQHQTLIYTPWLDIATPSIKKELQHSIQAKRLKEGKEKLKLNVPFILPGPYALTTTEEIRKERRRMSNKFAARKMRNKMKQTTYNLHQKCEDLESEQIRKTRQVEALRQERDTLISLLSQCDGSCSRNVLLSLADTAEMQRMLDDPMEPNPS